MVRLNLGLLGLAGSAAALPLVLNETIAATQAAAVTCVSGLYMIAARGSTQDPGEGSIAQVTTLVKALVPGSVSVAVDYPATIFDDGTYPASVTKGIKDTISKVHEYVDTCGASSKVVLLGYSQGGNIMTDALAGGVLKPDPLTSAYTQYIKAVTVFGDPTFTVGQSFDVGNATKSGIFSRGGSSLSKLNGFARVLRSYCMIHDTVCATGDSLSVHSAEVTTFASAAAQFIAGQALL
ncbi:carbohydrate esterase family 5 protein [Xylariaceae sp. FL0594]|nr:carbohydrate esterase family 5 protein [Xylariaceae sp. FL0594]